MTQFSKRFSKKWPLVAAMLLAVILGAMIIPWVDWDKVADSLEKFSHRSKPVVPPKAAVLLASTQDSDTFVVRHTVEPRGYALHIAETIAAAREILERDRAQIEVVVVDLALPGAQKLIAATRTQCPRAHIIGLSGPRETTQFSELLVARALN